MLTSWPFAASAQGCYISAHGDYICDTYQAPARSNTPAHAPLPAYSGPPVVTTMANRQADLANLVQQATQFKDNAIAAAQQLSPSSSYSGSLESGGSCNASKFPPGTNIVLIDDFETNRYTFNPSTTKWQSSDGNWATAGACQDFNLAVIDAPCVNGAPNKAIRLISRMSRDNRECKGGWGGLKTSKNTGEKFYKHRVEVGPSPSGTGYAEYGKDWWVGMRIYVPENFPDFIPLRTGARHRLMSIAQVIASQASSPGTDFKLGLSSDTGEVRWYIERAGDLGSIERGKWVDFVIHLKRSTGNDGVLQVWKNGVLVKDYRGRTTSQAAAPHLGQFKYGLYGGGTEPKALPLDYVLYFDDVKIGNGP